MVLTVTKAHPLVKIERSVLESLSDYGLLYGLQIAQAIHLNSEDRYQVTFGQLRVALVSLYHKRYITAHSQGHNYRIYYQITFLGVKALNSLL